MLRHLFKHGHTTSPQGKKRPLRRLWAVWAVVLLTLAFAGIKLLDRYLDKVVGEVFGQLVLEETGGLYRIAYDDLSFNPFTNELVLFNLVLQPRQAQAARAQRRNLYRARIPRLKLDVEYAWKIFLRRELEIVGARIVRPSLEMENFAQGKPLTLSRESGNLYKLISGYLERFEIGRFDVNGANFALINHYAHGTARQVFANVDLSLKNMFVDSAAAVGRKRFFYTESIALSLGSQQIALRDSLHVFSFDKLEVNTGKASIAFTNFRLAPKPQAGRKTPYTYRVHLPLFALNGIDFAGAYHDNRLRIAQIKLERPAIHLNSRAEAEGAKDGGNTMSALLAYFFDEVRIGEFHLLNAAMKVDKNDQEQFKVGHVNLLVENFSIDTSHYRNTLKLPNYSGLLLYLSDQAIHFADSAYTVRVKALGLSSAQAELRVQGLELHANETATERGLRGGGLRGGGLPIRRLRVSELRARYHASGQAWQQGHWQLGEVLLQSPVIDLRPTDQERPRARTAPSASKLRQLLGNYVRSVAVRQVQVREGRLSYLNPANRDSAEVQNLHLDFGPLLLHNQAEIDWAALLRPEYLALSIGPSLVSLPRLGHRLQLAQARWQGRGGRLQAKEVVIAALNDTEQAQTVEGTVREIAAEGLSPHEWATHRRLKWKQLDIVEPVLTLTNLATGASGGGAAQAQLAELQGGQTRIQQATALVYTPKFPLIWLQNLDLQAGQMQLGNLEQQAENWHTQLESLHIALDSFYIENSKGTFKLGSGRMKLASPQRQWQAEDLRLVQPLFVQVGQVAAQGIDFPRLWAEKYLSVDSLLARRTVASGQWPEAAEASAESREMQLPLLKGIRLGLVQLQEADATVTAPKGRHFNATGLQLDLQEVQIDKNLHPHTFLKTLPRHLVRCHWQEAGLRGPRFSLTLGPTELGQQATAMRFSQLALALHGQGRRHLSLSIPAGALGGIAWGPIWQRGDIDLESLELQSPELVLLPPPDTLRPAARRPWAAWAKALPFQRLTARRLDVQNASARFEVARRQGPKAYHFVQMALNGRNFCVGCPGELPLGGELKLKMPAYQHLLDSAQTVAYDSAVLHTQPLSLALHGVKLRPLHSPKAYFAKHSRQSTFLEIDAHTLRLHEPQLARLLSDKTLIAKSLLIDSVQITALRDKTKAPDSVYKALPPALFQRVPLPLRIDTLHLRRAQLHYQELLPSGETGTFALHGIAASYTPLSNLAPDSAHTAKLQASALLPGGGQLQVETLFDLASPSQAHRLYLQVNGPMNLAQLNSIVEPSARLRITRGQLDRLAFELQANEQQANGTMFFHYHNLHLAVVNKKTNEVRGLKSGLFTFVANTIVKNRNPPIRGIGNGRVAQIEYRRNVYKSVLNYWVKSTLAAALLSVGIRKKLNEKAPDLPPEAVGEALDEMQ